MTKLKVQVVVHWENEVLLFKTNESRGRFWQNITGGVDKGEKVFDAALREMGEESQFQREDGNLQVLDHEVIYTKMGKNKMKTFHEFCFSFKLFQKKDPIIDSSEHETYKWVKIKDIHRESFGFESNYDVFKKAMEADS